MNDEGAPDRRPADRSNQHSHDTAGERLRSHLARAVDALARGDELLAVEIATEGLRPYRDADYSVERNEGEASR